MVEEIRERGLQFLRTGVRTFPKLPWDVDGDGLQGFLRVLQDDGGIPPAKVSNLWHSPSKQDVP